MKYKPPSAQLMMASPLGTKLLDSHQTCDAVGPGAPEPVSSSLSASAPFKLRKSESTAGLVTFLLLSAGCENEGCLVQLQCTTALEPGKQPGSLAPFHSTGLGDYSQCS